MKQRLAAWLEKLTKIAFGNIGDFAQFRDDAEIVIDHAKAREAGAKVSIVDGKVGKGKTPGRFARLKSPCQIRFGP